MDEQWGVSLERQSGVVCRISHEDGHLCGFQSVVSDGMHGRMIKDKIKSYWLEIAIEATR